jgi:CubicO group peptidase (beta-lactamase class C family)
MRISLLNRRRILQCGALAAWAAPVIAAVRRDALELAAEVLAGACAKRQVDAAVLCVRNGGEAFARNFGAARSVDEMFLLGSISKPVTAAAVMTLYDRGAFRLDEPAQRFLPEFKGDARGQITMRHLLTHVSGLPDQLPENAALRSRHAPLSEFVAAAVRTPLLFEPGSRYSYSSMAILLAAEVARRLSATALPQLFQEAVFRPLGMEHSALGLGRFPLEAMMRCQAEGAAPESGAGNASAREWNWNSPYWRRLGAPWGGVHASAPDVARFFAEFLHREGKAIRPATAELMLRSHNPKGLTPRGLGFALGTRAGSPGCSEQTFGHTGSTGTLAWADPTTDTICVVLTTLPGAAANPHPRALAADQVAAAVS